MVKMTRSKKAFNQSLLQLLRDKPYSKISVKDIINESGYSKAAFYKQFADKDDCTKQLVNMYVDEYINLFLRLFSTPKLPQDISHDFVEKNYEQFFLFVYKERDFFLPLVTDETMLSFYTYFSIKIQELSIQKFCMRNDRSKLDELMVCRGVSGLMATIEYWFKHSLDFSPADLAVLCTKLDSLSGKNIQPLSL